MGKLEDCAPRNVFQDVWRRELGVFQPISFTRRAGGTEVSKISVVCLFGKIIIRGKTGFSDSYWFCFLIDGKEFVSEMFKDCYSTIGWFRLTLGGK